MDLRAAREAACWDFRRRGLFDNWHAMLPAFLDELERLDAEHAALYQAEMDLKTAAAGRLIAESPAPFTAPPGPGEPGPVRRRTPRKAAGS